MLGNHDRVFLVAEKIDRRLFCLCDECVGLSLAICLFFLRHEVRGAGIDAVLELLSFR